MYKLTGTELVKRLVDGITIPFAAGNTDYEEYKQWLANGNTPEAEFTDEELLAQKVAYEVEVAKNLLSSTDHKFFNGYKPKDSEDLLAIELERDLAREFIRANKV